MGNITPLKFTGCHTKQVRTGKVQGAWDPDISVVVVTAVGVPVEEFLLDIGMNTSR